MQVRARPLQTAESASCLLVSGCFFILFYHLSSQFIYFFHLITYFFPVTFPFTSFISFFAGGYGGFPPIAPYLDENSENKYDGFVTRADTWETFNGRNWTQLNWNNTFGGRAWMGE